jgi:hypothetical protein
LKWLVDGNEAHKVVRSETWNATANRFDYPQTPSRIMLSLWPAGKAGNAKGTVEWAGGEIDWKSKYMTAQGYYAAKVEQVTVECYDPPSGAKRTGSKSYKYTDKAVTNNTVEISNDFVILAGLENTGENPGDASKTKSASSNSETNAANMVPGGIIGGGVRNEPTAGATSQQSSGNNNNRGGGGSGGSSGTFQQNAPGQSSGASEPGIGKIGGSALAIVVAILGLLVL